MEARWPMARAFEPAAPGWQRLLVSSLKREITGYVNTVIRDLR